jgi:cobalamin synthase
VEAEGARQKLEAQEARESKKDQLEREHGELLEELRSLIPGAEVLFGFLLAIRFTAEFAELTKVQESVYYVTLLATATALVMLLAPAAYHRIRFREGDKEYMMRKGNREAIAGTAALATAFTGVLFVVTDLVFSIPVAIVVALAFFALTAWRWWAVALFRKARES